MYLLDTSALLEILYGTEKGINITKTISGMPLSTTSITLHEVAIGESQEDLKKILPFFDSIEILPFDKDSALLSSEIEKDLQKKGRMINRVDIFIAGICKKHNVMLITLDKGFRNINSVTSKIIE